MNKELKLDNIIAYDGVIATVKCLHYNYLTVSFNVSGNEVLSDVKYDKCAGLPLSPAILKKAGFEKNHSELIWKGCDDFFIMEYSEVHGYYYTGGEGCKLSVAIKYVHQLQNIVSSITGQELQITL